MEDVKLKRICCYCKTDSESRANAAVLIGAYSIIYLGKTALEAYSPLAAMEPFVPFRDAGVGVSTFHLTVQHCLSAIEKALKNQFFDFKTFDLEEYEHFEQVENGDLNIIIPGKFVAFATPNNNQFCDGYPTYTPEDYFPIFQRWNVTAVVRLSKKIYDHRKFTEKGYKFYDMYFPDGTTPSQDLLLKFISVAEKNSGAMAIHCKAGLGRTGTLIACYIMKHYRFTAYEAIAWCRLCRPGSVVGPQQEFVQMQEKTLHRQGDQFRLLQESRSLSPQTPVARPPRDLVAEKPLPHALFALSSMLSEVEMDSVTVIQPRKPRKPLEDKDGQDLDSLDNLEEKGILDLQKSLVDLSRHDLSRILQQSLQQDVFDDKNNADLKDLKEFVLRNGPLEENKDLNDLKDNQDNFDEKDSPDKENKDSFEELNRKAALIPELLHDLVHLEVSLRKPNDLDSSHVSLLKQIKIDDPSRDCKRLEPDMKNRTSSDCADCALVPNSGPDRSEPVECPIPKLDDPTLAGHSLRGCVVK
jgi:hypothetical protein